MMLTLAEIRARHFPPAVVVAPAVAPPLAGERAEWVAAVEARNITRSPAAGGGYSLNVGTVRAAVVRPEGGGWVVRNCGAACDSAPFSERAAADRLAMRIARLVALP